jgi:phenylacetate-CoA ligase
MTDLLANLPQVTLRHSPAETLRDLDRRYYDEAIQILDRERLLALQADRLRAAVRRVFERPVPFFARKLAEAGVEGPDDVKRVEDLDRIPVTVKQELRDAEAAHPPVGDYRGSGLRQNVRVGTSTGTTGTPTVMLWTRHDLLVECEAGARAFWRQGIRPGMILTHAHPAYLYSGGLMMTSVYEHLGCLPLWVAPPDTDELARQGLDMWRRITPDKPFMGFATGRFFEVAGKLGYDPVEAGLDFSKMPPLTRDGVLPLMTAGSEAMAYLGSPCEELAGGHVCEDWCIVQALHPETGQPVPDGQWGRLVVTTVGRDNFLLRYDLEEAVKLDRSACPCGETHLRGWWGGRFSDLVSAQGRSLMLADLERALKAFRPLRKPSLEYQVVRPADPMADIPLRIRVEVGEGGDDREGLQREAQAAATETLGVAVALELLDRDTLPRSGYKAKRVIDGE